MAQFKRSIAIIIGINQYQNGIPALKTAVNDATKLGQVLKADHGYEVALLRDQQVSLRALRSLLTEKLPSLIQPSDRLLFYFAGHGLAFNGDAGPEGYLIPQDAKLGDSTTYLPMTLVHDSLTALPCRHFLGIFDCCFAGAFRWSATRRLSPIPKVIHKERFARFLSDPAWQVITSAADDQEALDALALKDHRGRTGPHSPFAEALINALQANSQADASPPPRDGKPAGDGVITATELYQYLRDAVEPSTTDHAVRQTPGLWPLKNHGKGEFVFLVPGRQPDLPEAPKLDENANPYKGLEAFEEADQALFFGRQQLIHELQDFVEEHPLTVVLGASGTGKSSLVKAGLVPALKRDVNLDGQSLWQVLPIVRPGVSPLRATLQALTAAGLDQDQTLVSLEASAWGSALDASLQQWRLANRDRRLLLVIDQAEELFSLCRDGAQRQQFLQILAHLLARHPEQFHAVITLRSDFEPQFRNSPLEDHWSQDRFMIRPMNREELQAAIEAPAAAKVMYFDPPELVDRLIDEVTEMPGALPLLSFTLRELFLKYLRTASTRTNRAITEADYEAVGGIKQALINRAEEEYQALVGQDPVFADTIRHVMLRMVATSGTGNTRRQVLLSELDYPKPEGDRVHQVRTRFEQARLLVSNTTADEQPYVEPAHDALVEGWPRLLQWLESTSESPSPHAGASQKRFQGLSAIANPGTAVVLDEREKLLLQRRLTAAAEDWQRAQKAKFLWNADPRLPLLKQIRQAEPYWFNKLESDFVQKSIARHRRNTQTRVLAVLISTVAVLASLLAFRGLRQAAAQSEADRQRQLVLSKSNESISNALNDQPLQAYHNALMGYDLIRDNAISDEATRLSVYTALLRARYGDVASGDGRANGISGNSSPAFAQVNQIGLSKLLFRIATHPTRRELALAGENVIEIRAEDGALLATLEHPNVFQITYSPDGQLLASSADGTIRLWSMADGIDNSPLLEMTEHRDNTPPAEISGAYGYNQSINGLVFHPNGNWLISGQGDGSVKIWAVATGELVARAAAHGGDPSAGKVAIAPNGDLLATAGLAPTDGMEIKLWPFNQASPPDSLVAPIQTLTLPADGYDSYVTSLAFSPDSTLLASGHADSGQVRIWRLEGSAELLHTIDAHEDWVTALTFLPDNTLLSASSDNTLKLWDATSGNPMGTLRGHGSVIFDTAVAGDETLYSLSRDQTLRVWRRTIESTSTEVSASPQVSFPQALAMSLDGDRYAVFHAPAPENEVIQIWRQDGQLESTLTVELADMTVGASPSLTFNPSGQELVLTRPDGNIQLWDILPSPEQPTQTIVGNSDLNSVAFNAEGTLMAIAGYDGNITIFTRSGESTEWIEKSSFQICEASGAPHPYAQANGIAFDQDDQVLAIASQDGLVRLWRRHQWQQNTNTPPCLPSFQTLENGPSAASDQLPSHSNLGFTSANLLAVAAYDGTVNLWDLEDLQQPKSVIGTSTGGLFGQSLNTGGTFELALNPAHKLIAIGGNSGTIELWSEAGNFLQSLEGHSAQIEGLSFSAATGRLVSADYEGNIRVWELDPDQLASYGCQLMMDYAASNPDDTAAIAAISESCPSDPPEFQLFDPASDL